MSPPPDAPDALVQWLKGMVEDTVHHRIVNWDDWLNYVTNDALDDFNISIPAYSGHVLDIRLRFVRWHGYREKHTATVENQRSRGIPHGAFMEVEAVATYRGQQLASGTYNLLTTFPIMVGSHVLCPRSVVGQMDALDVNGYFVTGNGNEKCMNHIQRNVPNTLTITRDRKQPGKFMGNIKCVTEHFHAATIYLGMCAIQSSAWKAHVCFSRGKKLNIPVFLMVASFSDIGMEELREFVGGGLHSSAAKAFVDAVVPEGTEPLDKASAR